MKRQEGEERAAASKGPRVRARAADKARLPNLWVLLALYYT